MSPVCRPFAAARLFADTFAATTPATPRCASRLGQVGELAPVRRWSSFSPAFERVLLRAQRGVEGTVFAFAQEFQSHAGPHREETLGIREICRDSRSRVR
jgi:hypothetical protein